MAPDVALTIAGMALATYATRAGGYWLVQRARLGRRARGALEAVPGAILIALIAPLILATGPAETLAAAITVLAALRLPTLAAIVIGIGSVVLLRALIG